MEWALKMKGKRMRNPVAVLLIVACLALPAGASSLHLTENGDIEQPLTTGWDQSIAGSYLYIVRGTAFDADPDYEVRVSSNNGHGNAKLWQSIIIPNTDVQFSAKLSSAAVDGGGAWCAAGLILTYLDVNGAPLGKTALAATSSICPWTGSSTFHIIDTNGGGADYGFTPSDELLNLPGIDGDDIHEIELSLLVSAANC